MEQIRLENFSKSVKLKYLINSTIIDYIEQMIEVRQIEKDTINFQVYIFLLLLVLLCQTEFQFPEKCTFQIIVA